MLSDNLKPSLLSRSKRKFIFYQGETLKNILIHMTSLISHFTESVFDLLRHPKGESDINRYKYK